MLNRHLVTSTFAGLAAFALVACSDESPIAPNDVQNVTTLARGATQGTLYQLDVRPAGLGAVLDAYVLDAAGEPATDGTAVFYYCSLQGNPAPSTACVTGSAVGGATAV